MLAGVIDLDYQEEIRLLIYNGGREENVPWGISCPVVKVNVKLQPPNSGRTINGPNTSGIEVWVISPAEKTIIM